MADYSSIDEMGFGEAMAELESIVRNLEGGQLELEESLSRYERGVALIAALQSKLSSAEQKVTALLGQIQPEGGSAVLGDSGGE